MATKGKINVDFTMRYIGALRANRIVANPNRYSTINYKDIVTYAARAAHVPESSIEVAMDALYDALSYFVLNGHNVKIDGLGTFFFGINAYAEEQIENAGADAIHRLKIGYLPEKDLREAMNNVAVTTTYTNPGNLAIDESVPASINEYGWMRTQTDKNVNFFGEGRTVQVPKAGLYLRLTGARLNQLDQIIANMDYMLTEDGEQGYADTEVSAQIVAKSAKTVIAYVPYPPIEDESLVYGDCYMTRLIIRGLNADEETYQVARVDLSHPWAANPIIARNISVRDYKTNDIIKILKGEPMVAVAGHDVLRVGFVGANMTLAPSKINFTNCTAEWVNAGASVAVAKLSNIVGDVVVSTTIPEGLNLYPLPLTIVVGQASTDPVVTSLSANGISVANGGSSTVLAGQSYNFAFAGANLGGLTQSNLVVPQGATISNFAATASQVSFRLTIGEEGGNIGIIYNGASLFSVSVTIPANISASITSIGGVGNNGTVQVTPNVTSATVRVVGTGLDTLSASNFVMSGYTMELSTGTATERNLTMLANTGFAGGTLRVQVSDTTIFTVTIDTGGEASF